MLRHVTNRPNLVTPNYAMAAAESLQEFDQEEFYDDLERISMDDTGYVYVPAACRASSDTPAETCLLHVHFHGCLMYDDLVSIINLHVI